MQTFYTAKRVSDDGVRYLCNHREKNGMLWMEERQIRSYRLFTEAQYAKGTLTKLIKSQPEYEKDKFSIVKVKM